MDRIRVMVVDDSALVRQTMSRLLEADPQIEVIATANDPYIAAEKMRKQAPDVITLDVEMPRMDGISFLRKIMSQHPLPVVICSTLVESTAETTFKALEYGAVDIIQKPKVGTRQFLHESRILLIDAVKAAAKTKPHLRPLGATIRPKNSADVMLPRLRNRALTKTTEKVVMIGASTGGTEAIRQLLETLPGDSPGMVIVQHMPEGFTAAFAKRLNELCEVEVKEAKDGDSVIRGRVLIAPGNRHTLLKRSGARYTVEVKGGPLVSRHRPSVDVLFRSATQYAASNAVGVILTGMGSDGAHGLLELKQQGAATIAQDEDSCVVFGMPAEAIKLGAVDHTVPLDAIAAKILQLTIDD